MAESSSMSLPPPTPMPDTGIQAPPATERRPRRPRAREVSSRYLSPSPSSCSSSSSSSSEYQHLTASPRNAYPAPSPFSVLPKKHHQQTQTRSRPFSSDPEGADENRPPASVRRSSSQTPLGLAPAAAKPPATIKKRTVVRLFADNNASSSLEDPADPRRRPRPGTPMVPHPAADGFGGGVKVHHRPPTPVRVSLFPFEKGNYGRGIGDNRLDETSSENSFSDSEICSVSSQGGLCDSPPLLPPVSCRSRPVDVRSSMPEVDLLPTMSARRAAEACSGQQEVTDDSACRASTNSLCLRSLTSAITGRQQQHPFNLNKSVSRPLFSLRPPQPPTTKSVADMKRVRKASTRQEEVHSLRLLDNHFVQWRFINAKAQGAAAARKIAAEKSLYGLFAKMPGLQSSLTDKRIKLEQLRRREGFSSIMHSQMPHLEEWSIMEDDYSSSLSGVTKALHNASLRLPITGNVKVDIREIKEVLDSTLLMLEFSSPHVAKFLPKAENIENVASDLASVISIHKSLIEECGNLLSQAHRLQVIECSLRSQIMQKTQCRM